MNSNQRLKLIDPSDVIKVLEVDERRARRILARIRKRFGKDRGQPVLLMEFCAYTGHKWEDVVECISRPNKTEQNNIHPKKKTR